MKIGILLIAATGLLLAGCTVLDPSVVTGPDGADTEAGTDDNPFKVTPGDCFDYDSGEEKVASVDVVDCSVAHSYEAYASIMMTGDEYPGDDAVQTEGDQDCQQPFTDYVGVPFDESKYDFRFFSPTEASWNDTVLQDREILCLIVADDKGEITGSVKGTKQ